MSKHDPVMTRMKENYENRAKTFLTRRTPVIIRLDGKAFHTYTRGLKKPFDNGLIQDMQETTKFLCENIQGAKCGYTQSDEISILVTDYKKLTSQAWFNYSVQKMTSISSSLCTAKFNQLTLIREDIQSQVLAFFDSRVFNIPKEEVSNYFLARQRDAVKNSISMLAQSLYSHKELDKKNGNQKQEMCFQKGHNWNDLSFEKKRGSFVVKNTYVNNKFVISIRNNTQYSSPLSGKDNVIGDLWYQPDIESTFYPDKRGRLLEWAESEHGLTWCDVPIDTIRTKWEVIETPHFNEEVFKYFI